MNTHPILLCFLSLCISCISYAAPPPNDAFAQRIMLSGSSGAVTSHTAGCSLEPGEPYHMFDPYGTNSLWWSWTAPASGLYAFDVVNSEYSTIVAVYQGNSLTNLSRIGYYISSYINFNATAGSNYQVAVVNRYPGDSGKVILRYYQETLSPWFVTAASIEFNPWASSGINGSILYSEETIDQKWMVRTNRFGLVGQDRYTQKNIQKGLTVIDKDNSILVNNENPADLSSNYWVKAFNGSSLVAYDWARKMLVMYQVDKNGLTLKGEQPSEEIHSAWFAGSQVLTVQYEDKDALYETQYGVNSYNKTLTKTKWSEPLAPGHMENAFNNGLTCRLKPDPYMLTLEYGKRGKKYYTRKLPYSLTSFYDIRADSKGGLLYWWHTGVGYIVTNTPLSYIKKNGKLLFENQDLPNAGSVWRYGCFNGKYLYIIKANGGSSTVIGYKIGKKIVKMNTLSVSNFDYIKFIGKQLTIFTRQSGPPYLYGFKQYDQKMKKMTWEESLAEGGLYYLGDGTFSRRVITPASGQTNYTYKIFNKKGTIAEHTIVR